MSSMDAFPDELWSMVFHNLGRKEWLNLCRTCSRFRNIAQAHLYRQVNLKQDVTTLPPSGSASLFERTLSERQGRALLVRRMNLIFMSEDMHDKIKWASNYILRELSSFHNLKKLRLESVHLDLDARSTIQSLPHLETIHVYDCTVDPNLSSMPFTMAVSERKLNLEVTRPRSGDGWAHIVPGRVQSLSVTWGEKEVLACFTRSGQGCHLTTLNCDFQSTKSLLALLTSTPQLRHIYLRYSERAASFSLPGTAIPLLETFHGSASLHEKFLNGRPVHTVDLEIDDSSPYDVLRSLQLSTVSVRDLTVTSPPLAKVVPMGDVLRHAPFTIESLTFQHVTMESILSCVPVFGRFPDLHTFNGSQAWYNQNGLTRRKCIEFIEGFSEACVSLREVRLHVLAIIDGKWVKKYHGAWEYYSGKNDRLWSHR